MQKRVLTDLINTVEPAWPLIKELIDKSANAVEVLPASDPARSEALLSTQVTTRSAMGAIVYETGGILLDHGWLRILGSGSPRLRRSLPRWNASVDNGLEEGGVPFLFIGDDVVGGFFAVDGGGLGQAGNVFYYAPDSLEWENLGMGYGQFIEWCLTGELSKFYEPYRWSEWKSEIASISGEQGLSVYPFLWAQGPPIGERERGVVPIMELFGLHLHEFPKQLALRS